MPKAFPRSVGSVKVVVSRARTDGARSAPNAPWMLRAATSMGKLSDAPPSAEAEAKPISPMRSARFRPDDVADAAAEEQEAAEGEGVTRDHPLAVGVGEVEVMLRGGQRNVDDRVVEDHHQLGHAQDRQDPPSTGMIRIAI